MRVVPFEEVDVATEVETYVGIVFCPVCCSNVDVEGESGATVTCECVSCSQVWTMELDSERIIQHGQN